MAYIMRDTAGKITGVFTNQQPDIAEEFLADDNAEVMAFEAGTSAAQLWAAYQANAKAALSKSDITILRCAENAVPAPLAWATYRNALRGIISTTTGDPTATFPPQPEYPAGT